MKRSTNAPTTDPFYGPRPDPPRRMKPPETRRKPSFIQFVAESHSFSNPRLVNVNVRLFSEPVTLRLLRLAAESAKRATHKLPASLKMATPILHPSATPPQHAAPCLDSLPAACRRPLELHRLHQQNRHRRPGHQDGPCPRRPLPPRRPARPTLGRPVSSSNPSLNRPPASSPLASPTCNLLTPKNEQREMENAKCCDTTALVSSSFSIFHFSFSVFHSPPHFSSQLFKKTLPKNPLVCYIPVHVSLRSPLSPLRFSST